MNTPSHQLEPAAAVPRATYRLQLNHTFTFRDAARIVPYLARLGISHVYASPILKARPGSMHGYDVVSHTELNPELGTRQDFDALIGQLHSHGMGLIVDIVPNHIGVMGSDNERWLDVLENGPAARHAVDFDIDWQPVRESMRQRILVPLLGEPYGNVLERGELKLELDAASGSFSAHYHEHRLPIDPREYPRIFAARPLTDADLPPDDADRGDFESLLTAFGNLPPRGDTSAESVNVRYRDKEAHKRRLARLLERSPAIHEYLTTTLTALNGDPSKPRSFDALDALLDAQAYRLSYWRVALDEINYRRFFDVNDLAALRMDEPGVFDDTHALILELVANGSIDGLRIDHSDGLYDPQEYFERLQARAREAGRDRPLYVLTEKILAAHERLPESWQIHGTTGYEFAALSTTWLVCGEEEARITRRHRQFTGTEDSFAEIAYDSKRLVMRATLAAEVEVLATQLDRIAHLDRHTADFTRAALREAIREVIACFPVYRTYISPRGVSEEDRRIVHWAVNVARKRSAGTELSVFDFLRDVLLGDLPAAAQPSHRQAALEFAMKFQQVTAPVTAKGVEDTSFYRYNRLVCLNEVGGDPGRFAVSSAALHQASLERAKIWPHTMLATSTHDTKRGEDVRARIAVLSELPDLWTRHVTRWARLNRSKRRQLEDGPAPNREDEYLIYQSLVGIFAPREEPARTIERLQAYAIKAAREAKRSTSWIDSNTAYEQALSEFIAQLLAENSAFQHDFTQLAATVAFFGRINSLALAVLKSTSPGIPDYYQGSETTIFTLVDPDNRSPVDFEAAEQRLTAVTEHSESPRSLLSAQDEDLSKLYVIARLLELRRRDPELFASGTYLPLQVEGARHDHILAFARVHEERACVVVVPRWSARLMQGRLELPLGAPAWEDTRVLLGEVPAPRHDVLSAREPRIEQLEQQRMLRVADLLSEFPVAVLTNVS